MSNLATIARGWYMFMKAPKKLQPLIEKRISICDSCPYKEQLSETGVILIQALNKSSSIYKCGHCMCPIAAKTADPLGKCPIGKW
jgi:hypothetical protein